MFIAVNRLGGRAPRPVGLNPAAVAVIWDCDEGASVTLISGESFQIDVSRAAFEAAAGARKGAKGG